MIKNFKTLKKKSEEDIRRWKENSRSWTGRINTVKMAILTKTMCRFRSIPIKIPTQFFTELEMTNFSFAWKHIHREKKNYDS